jgi:hypothetical protein
LPRLPDQQKSSYRPTRARQRCHARAGAHNFATAGFGKLCGEKDFIGPGDRPNLLRHMALEIIYQSAGIISPSLERDKDTDRPNPSRDRVVIYRSPFDKLLRTNG